MSNLPTRRPLVSVVILNYKGQGIFPRCLASVINSSYRPLEVIVIDNSPLDGCVREALSSQSDTSVPIRVREMEQNVGFCLGFNLGIEESSGEYLLLLNNDTEIGPRSIEALTDFMERKPRVGLCEGKIVNEGPKYRGQISNPLIAYGFGVLGHAGPPESDRGQFDSVPEVFSAIGVWPFVRKSVLDEVGAYDVDFFIAEEIRDLCWRVWLSGYRVAFVPDAVTKHIGRLSTVTQTYGEQVKSVNVFHEAKNSVQVLFKNLSLPRLYFALITTACLRFLELAWLETTGRARSAGLKVGGYKWIIAHLDQIMAKRRDIQRRIRRVPDRVALRTLVPMNLINHFRHHLTEDAFL